MLRRPPRSTRTDTLFPYTTLFRSGDQITSTQSVLFYLVTYGFMTVGAFAIVSLVRDAGGEATHLSRWAGLGKESPVIAGAMTLVLLGFAGIPLTDGRSEERRVGKEGVSTCQCPWSQYK